MFSFFPFSICVVSGHSMQPGLKKGGRIVVFRWSYAFSQPRIGDVVVFSGSDGKSYVKRITATANKKEFVVEGDNKSDSKKLPPIKKEAIIGKVIAKY